MSAWLRWLWSVVLFVALSTSAARAAEFREAPPMAEPGWLPVTPADWVEIEGPAFHIHGPARDELALRRLSDHATRSLPRLAEALGAPIGGEVHVYVADSDERFRSLQPGAVPSWADGTAWPSSGTIFLHGSRARSGLARPLTQVLDHELVHILLGRALAPNEVPAWLQEGTAQVLAGEVGLDLHERIGRGMASGGLPSFDELERGFPHDPGRADLAYAMSASLVEQIQARGGPDALPRLVHAVAEGQGMRGAVRTVTGDSLKEIQASWRSGWLSWLPAWLIGSRLVDYLMVGTAVVFFVGGAARTFRRTRKYTDWRTEGAALRRMAWELAARRGGTDPDRDPFRAVDGAREWS
jgi:hypothetical protein